MTVVAGVDFGTASVRVSLIDSERGRLGAGVAPYPVLRAPADPLMATQRHADHLAALERAMAQALGTADIDRADVAALAVATTGSTVVAVDKHLQPLGDYYLWCDHRAWREAERITQVARAQSLPALAYCGGTYSAEWGFAKLLHWLRNTPALRPHYASAIEHCDLIVATLCGAESIDQVSRSICAMGHKWLWSAAEGGLPPASFLAEVDPLLADARERLSGHYATSGAIAGGLSPHWAARLGLRAGIPIPVGALDAHWDAIGAGCRLGDIVNVIGTSSCIMALSGQTTPIAGIPGVVPGSIHPDFTGIESGLAAVGDLFDAIARRANSDVAQLAAQTASYRAGQTGLVRIPWDNGDRSVLADPHRGGVLIGLRLDHVAADEFFAAIEGTALHTRLILDRLRDAGVPVSRVINGGGIPQRNARLNQVYASALKMPVLIPNYDPVGIGSAIMAFLAAGTFQSIEQAQDQLCADHRVVDPLPEEMACYDEQFRTFEHLYHSPLFDKARPSANL